MLTATSRSLLLFALLIVQLHGLAQGQGAAAPPFANHERSNLDTVYIAPGMAYNASYYCWTDGATLTGNWVAASVPWLEPITFPVGQTAIGCDGAYVIRYRVNAPVTPGVYETEFADLNGIWSTWTLRIKVAEIPNVVDEVYTNTLNTGQTYQLPATASGTEGVDGVGCTVPPYLPATDLIYEYRYYPDAPWASAVPDSFQVQAGTDGSLVYEVFSNVPGNFVTYLYGQGTWFGWPYITKVDITFVSPSGIASPSEVPGLNSMVVAPVPVDAQLVLRMSTALPLAGTLVLTDALGHVVHRSERRVPTGNTVLTVEVGQLPAGTYVCKWMDRSSGASSSKRVMIVH